MGMQIVHLLSFKDYHNGSLICHTKEALITYYESPNNLKFSPLRYPYTLNTDIYVRGKIWGLKGESLDNEWLACTHQGYLNFFQHQDEANEQKTRYENHSRRRLDIDGKNWYNKLEIKYKLVSLLITDKFIYP